MKIQGWTPCQEGDIVDVIAPGFASKTEELESARRFLIRWGLVPHFPAGLIAPHFLHANSDDKRFYFLKQAILNPESNVIWCLRGGYGSNRLLPWLRKMKKPKHKKLLIGISDITSLHVYLTQEWGWQTLHAPLLDRLGLGKVPARYEKELYQILFGEKRTIEFKKLKAMNEAARRMKTVRGSMIGGNLTVLQSTIGTPYQVKANNKFLFIEDLGERGYRVDRMLEHLQQAGVLKGCRGLIIGDFLGGQEENGKPLWPLVFKHWAAELNLPVFSGLEAGHGLIQRPVPFNTPCQLTGGTSPLLVISTGVHKS